MARRQQEPQHRSQQESSPALAGISRAANPWMSSRLALSKRKRVFRTVLGILNNLTLENFNVSVKQILNADIDSAEILMGVSSFVYNKAVLEPMSCSMIAEMCVYLSKALPKFPSDDDEDRNPITFRRILLNRCQQEFEKADNRLPEIRQLTEPEEEVERAENETLLKLRALGNIRFIGELFKQKVIAEKLVHYCIAELLGSAAKTPPAEEKIETLCQLLSSVGKQLEESKSSTRALEVYFSQLKKHSACSRLPSHVRLLILNIIDLRANNWVPRQEEVAAKKHLNEIPAEAEKNLNLCPGISSLTLSLPEKEDVDQASHFYTEEKQRESSHRGGEYTQSLLSRLSEKKMEEEPLVSGASSLVSNKAVLEPPSCSMNAEVCALSEGLKVFRTVTGILDKLTPENFDVSVEQISNAGIESAKILMRVTSFVYNKAVLEPASCSMYAVTCAYLSKALPEFASEDGERITYCRMLLTRCQEEFEGADKRLAEIRQLTKPEQEAERAEKERLLKLRTYGNIKFIGELFKQKMISERLVHSCIRKLLGSDAKTPPAEEKIETLCQLLSSVGKQLEETKYFIKAWEGYFSQLKEYSACSRLPSRVRLLILNIIDLRANNWVPRQEEVAANKHLNEIPAEAEKVLHLCPGVSSLSVSLRKNEDLD